MNSFFANFEQHISKLLDSSHGLPLPALIFISFGGGLAASLTPCVLPMIPLYITYIGITEISTKLDALKKSILFCTGSGVIFSLLGIFASFASFIMVEFRGYVNIVVGIFILLMCFFLLEIIKLPLPQIIKNIPAGSPLIVGIAFALVSSPCASPILFAVLAMASTAGSSLKSALIMAAYSVGYTGIIFLTAIFAGVVKQFNFFKKHSKIVSVVSSIILGILGIYYLYSGVMWFLG